MTGDVGTTIAVLATDSKPLAIGLTALLLSIPPIDEVKCVDSVGQLLRSVAELRPALILLDTAIADDRMAEARGGIQASSPESQLVLLSSNMDEYRVLLDAGEDPVIMKGTDPGRLARILEFLLKDLVTV